MLPAERKQMPSARPRHFPSLSEGAERFAGSRGCGITSCPGRASPHHPGYFVLEGEARQGAGHRQSQHPHAWAAGRQLPPLLIPPWPAGTGGPQPGPSSSKSPAAHERSSPDPQVPRIPPRGRSQDAGTGGREGLPPTRTSSSCPGTDTHREGQTHQRRRRSRGCQWGRDPPFPQGTQTEQEWL